MSFAKVICGGVSFLALVIATVASPFEVWHPRSPTLTHHNLNGVAYGNGRFVAVGGFGTVVTSTNGIDWSLQSLGTSRQLNTITFTEDRFIIGGDFGAIFWSSNGLNWTDASIPINYNLTAFGFGRGTKFPNGQAPLTNGLFVAMASSQDRTLVLTSPDGVVWTTNTMQFIGLDRGFTSIAFGKNFFVASGPKVFPFPKQSVLSSDGTNWYSGGYITGPLVFARDLFVVVLGFNIGGDSIVVYTSPTLSSWPPVSSGPVVVQSVCFGGEKFVAVGGPGYTANSPDGTNWTTHFAPTDATLRGVAFGNGLYVTVGSAGIIMSSPDAVVWTKRTDGTGRNISAVTVADDGFFAVGSAGSVAWSTNGITWENGATPTTKALFDAVQADGKYVVVGETGIILAGNGPTNLVQQDSRVTASLYGIVSGGGTLVTVGGSGTILTSPAGGEWFVQTSGTTNSLFEIAYGGNQFVAVGQNGTLLTSATGEIWTPQNSGTTRNLFGVAYGRGRFVVTASAQADHGLSLITSEDGVTWQDVAEVTRNFGFVTQLTGVCFGNGYFLTAETGGARFYVSVDGITWERHLVQNILSTALDLAYNNGTFVRVGHSGVISQSDPIVRLEATSGDTKQLTVEGPKHRAFRIEGTEQPGSITSWRELTILSWPASTWTDPESPTGSNRFYRAVLLP